MKLNIPAEKAKQIIRDRLSELNEYNFNSQAWKDRTVLDMREIFPLGSMQWSQISQIRFDTFITADKSRVFAEAKETAKQLLESYIDYIDKFSEVNIERELIVENNYQKKYSDLLADWNSLVPQYNDLLKTTEQIHIDSESKDNEIELLNIEINRIKENTLQLDSLTLGKLFKSLASLPIKQIFVLIGIVISIIGGSFTLGKLYQENASNTSQYEIKKENDDLKSQIKLLNNDIDKLKKLDAIKIDTMKIKK
jgi:uncharacterized protein YukE